MFVCFSKQFHPLKKFQPKYNLNIWGGGGLTEKEVMVSFYRKMTKCALDLQRGSTFLGGHSRQPTEELANRYSSTESVMSNLSICDTTITKYFVKSFSRGGNIPHLKHYLAIHNSKKEKKQWRILRHVGLALQ